MSSKKHILVVEDVPFIFNEVKESLERVGFSVDGFTPSVEKAIARINSRKPDLVLLDIELKGEHNGIYLGSLLRLEYQIPYIYVTNFDDDYTFNKSTQTHPEAFMSKKTLQLFEDDVVVNTKPEFDEKHLIREMMLILQRYEQQPVSLVKDGIWAYTDYKSNQLNYGNEDVSQVLVMYKDIAYFTTNSDQVNAEKTKSSKKTEYVKMKENNTRVYTWKKESFIIPHTLKQVAQILPNYFEKISSDYVVSLHDEMIDGRINGRRLKINGEVLTISDTYKANVERKLNTLYQKMEKKK